MYEVRTKSGDRSAQLGGELPAHERDAEQSGRHECASAAHRDTLSDISARNAVIGPPPAIEPERRSLRHHAKHLDLVTEVSKLVHLAEDEDARVRLLVGREIARDDKDAHAAWGVSSAGIGLGRSLFMRRAGNLVTFGVPVCDHWTKWSRRLPRKRTHRGHHSIRESTCSKLGYRAPDRRSDLHCL